MLSKNKPKSKAKTNEKSMHWFLTGAPSSVFSTYTYIGEVHE